jgi:hypothetical protein
METGDGGMTKEEMGSTLHAIIERWGFPVLVAVAAGWILRNDVLLPLVEEHRAFVKLLGETQRDISQALTEQTRLLYALQPRHSTSEPTKAKPNGEL